MMTTTCNEQWHWAKFPRNSLRGETKKKHNTQRIFVLRIAFADSTWNKLVILIDAIYINCLLWKKWRRKKRCSNFNIACMWDREMRLAVSAEQDDLDAWPLLCYRFNSCQIVKVVSINIWTIPICGPKKLNYPNSWPCIVLCPLTANWCEFNKSKLVMKKNREQKSKQPHIANWMGVCVCERECHYHRCWCVSSSFMRINQVAMMWLTFVKWKYSFSPTCYSNRFHTVDMRFGFTYHMHYSICWNEIRC